MKTKEKTIQYRKSLNKAFLLKEELGYLKCSLSTSKTRMYLFIVSVILIAIGLMLEMNIAVACLMCMNLILVAESILGLIKYKIYSKELKEEILE